jgi:hypothetical protein
MITQLTSAIHHRICYCPVISKTIEVRVIEVETIKHGDSGQEHIRILSRTLEDCSGVSECGIIRVVEGGSFIIDWQFCPLNLSLQTGRQVWHSHLRCTPLLLLSTEDATHVNELQLRNAS